MLKKNELFITTTDTLIGIGAKINDDNLKKIYELKKRPNSKKIVVVIGSLDQLIKIEKIDEKASKFIEKYWPGPTTLIINNNAYRMPNNEGLLKFILEEGPFFLTSANISGNKNCETLEEAKKMFPSINRVYNFGYGTNIASSIIDVATERKLR
ncbi:MAG: L-threonylcarbamoyladenylate synthase [Metamycoplasmataceae bacterium]